MQPRHSILAFHSGTSFLHRCDPRIKLATLLVWEFLIWRADIPALLVLAAVITLLYLWCRTSLLASLAALRVIIILALFSIAAPIGVAIYRDGWAHYIAQPLVDLLPNGRYALRLLITAIVVQLFAATTPIARWVDTIEWLIPLRRLRGAIGLLALVTLTHIPLIQRTHHQIIRGIDARLRTRRRTRRFALRTLSHYTLSLILACARSANLLTIAIHARKFAYIRTPPHFSPSIRPNLTLITITTAITTAILLGGN